MEFTCALHAEKRWVIHTIRILDGVAVAAAYVAAGAEAENQDEDVGQENQTDKIADAMTIGQGQVVVQHAEHDGCDKAQGIAEGDGHGVGAQTGQQTSRNGYSHPYPEHSGGPADLEQNVVVIDGDQSFPAGFPGFFKHFPSAYCQQDIPDNQKDGGPDNVGYVPVVQCNHKKSLLFCL